MIFMKFVPAWRRGIGEMGSKVGGAAPGFEPGTSCMRVRSRSLYATGAAPRIKSFILFDAFESLIEVVFNKD